MSIVPDADVGLDFWNKNLQKNIFLLFLSTFGPNVHFSSEH